MMATCHSTPRKSLVIQHCKLRIRSVQVSRKVASASYSSAATAGQPKSARVSCLTSQYRLAEPRSGALLSKANSGKDHVEVLARFHPLAPPSASARHHGGSCGDISSKACMNSNTSGAPCLH